MGVGRRRGDGHNLWWHVFMPGAGQGMTNGMGTGYGGMASFLVTGRGWEWDMVAWLRSREWAGGGTGHVDKAHQSVRLQFSSLRRVIVAPRIGCTEEGNHI